MDSPRLLLVIGNGLDPALCAWLAAAGWTLHTAADFAAAGTLLRAHPAQVGLLLQAQVDAGFCAAADAFLRRHPGVAWIIASESTPDRLPAHGDLILDHAFDHHRWPPDAPRLLATLGHAFGNAQLRRQRTGRDAASGGDVPLIGRSPAVAAERRLISRIAAADAPVLISGETGSGKAFAAKAIHAASARAAGPFVPVHCAAIAPALIAAALFGTSRGALGGAVVDQPGLIEAAAQGTLYLDGVADLPPDAQAGLLRLVETGAFTPVGSAQGLRADVRVIAATTVDIAAAVVAGRFREDLFYRLGALPLHVRPLRDRSEDIELLAQHAFHHFAHEKAPRLLGFTQPALAAMRAWRWPGNVGELIQCVRRAMVVAEGRLIRLGDLGLPVDEPPPVLPTLEDARASAERSAVGASLQRNGMNVTRAARQLGVSRMTLYRLMAKYGIGLAD